MIVKPALKTFLTIFPISDTTWGLRGGSEELWKIKLSDERALRAFCALLPYLNGRRQVDEILDEVSGQGVDRQVAQSLLEHLENSSFLEEGDASFLPPEEAERFRDQLTFFSRFTTEGGAKFQARLRGSRVAVVGDGTLHRVMARQLRESGFGEVTLLSRGRAASAGGNGHGPSLPDLSGPRYEQIVLSDGFLWPDDRQGELPGLFVVPQEAHDPDLLEAMDAFSKERGIPWMLLRLLDPHEGWIGPLFIPGETPSYVSLEARLRGNVEFFEEYRAFDGYLRAERKPAAPCGGLAAFAEILCGIATAEIVKYVSGFGVPHLAGRFLTIDLLSWETETHQVLRVPRLEAQSYSRPRVFPWKDIPYGDKITRRA